MVRLQVQAPRARGAQLPRPREEGARAKDPPTGPRAAWVPAVGRRAVPLRPEPERARPRPHGHRRMSAWRGVAPAPALQPPAPPASFPSAAPGSEPVLEEVSRRPRVLTVMTGIAFRQPRREPLVVELNRHAQAFGECGREF